MRSNSRRRRWQRRTLALVCASAFWSQQVIGADVPQLQPSDVPKRGSAEFYSTRSTAKVQMAVNIWGEVQQPGIHFVPIGATLTEAVSAAGGPTTDADADELFLRRGAETWRLDLLAKGPETRLQADDVVVVERNFKRDLPLVLSAVTTVVSVLTLYFVSRKQ
jgi:NADH:ubiquinone oxidoreductase subunit F (NADH-binding)